MGDPHMVLVVSVWLDARRLQRALPTSWHTERLAIGVGEEGWINRTAGCGIRVILTDPRITAAARACSALLADSSARLYASQGRRDPCEPRFPAERTLVVVRVSSGAALCAVWLAGASDCRACRRHTDAHALQHFKFANMRTHRSIRTRELDRAPGSACT